MHVLLFCILSFVGIFAEEATFSNPCESALKIGKPAKDSNSTGAIKYFFDSSLNLCLPYRTEGGDDGYNSFASEDACRQCLPADYFFCGANANSTGACGYAPNSPDCPKGSICKSGGMVGMCCPEETETAYAAEYSPSCPKRSTLVTQKVFWGEDTFRGKSCSHKFCPLDSECHQGKWLAFCCRK